MPDKCRVREVMHYYSGTCVFEYHVCNSPMSPPEYFADPHDSPPGDCNHPGPPNCTQSHVGDAAAPAARNMMRPAAYDGLPLRPHIVNGRVIEDYVVKFRDGRCWRYAYVVVVEKYPHDELMGRTFVNGHGWEVGSVPPEGVLEIEVDVHGDNARGQVGSVMCDIHLNSHVAAAAPPPHG